MPLKWRSFHNVKVYEEDCIIQDNTRGGYDVSCGGKFIGNFNEMDDALTAIKNWQDKNQFFPTIWFVSDHGNMWPIDLKGNEIKTASNQSNTATEIQKAFETMGKGVEKGSRDQVEKQMQEQGYVDYRNPMAAELHAKRYPQHIKEVLPNGTTRFKLK